MTESKEEKSEKKASSIESWVGLMVVFSATFMGIANVKDNNIVQKMQQKQVEHNDNWGWFQARNIRASVYETTADELSLTWPGETAENQKKRQDLSAKYAGMAKSQEMKMNDQKAAAETALKDYDALNAEDDKFDMCDTLLALSLALMGITALTKKWALFFVALIPMSLGTYIGIAGFVGFHANLPFLDFLLQILS